VESSWLNPCRNHSGAAQPILNDWFRDIEPPWRPAAIGRMLPAASSGH